jgi:hypothetical protein
MENPVLEQARVDYSNGQNPDDPVELARNEMSRRQLAERQKAASDRELHELAIHVEAEGKNKQLEELWEQIPAAVRSRWKFEIRLKAMELLIRSDIGTMYAQNKQMRADDLSIEMARYALTGRV